MASNDILVKLILNTALFDNALVKSKGSLKDFEKSAGYLGQTIKSVTTTLAKLTAAGAAAKLGYDTFTRTMNSCESSADSLRRSQAALSSVVDNFFYSLNAGSFDSFLAGLDGIIKKARDAYDAIDTLGTMKTFNNPAIVEAQAKIDDARAVLSDPSATKEQRSAAVRELKANQTEYAKILKQQREQALKSYYASVDRAIGNAKITREEIDQYLKNYNSYDTAKNRFQTLKTLVDNGTTAGATYSTSMGVITGPSQMTKAAQDIERSNEYQMLKALVEKEGALAEALQYRNEALGYDRMIAQSQRTVNRAVKSSGLYSGAGKGVKTETKEYEEGTIAWFQERVKEQQKIVNESADQEARFQAQRIIDSYTIAIKEIKRNASLGEGTVDSAINALKNKPGTPDYASMVGISLPEKITGNIPQTTKNLDSMADKLKNAQGAASSLANSFYSINAAAEQMGNKGLAGAMGMLGDISTLAQGMAQLAMATGIAGAAKMPFPASIGAIATIAASIMSMISRASKFADGGIVSGQSFDGDRIPARLNSGEMVINQAQQRQLWSMVTGEQAIGSSAAPWVDGETLYLPIRNYLRRTGKTW